MGNGAAGLIRTGLPAGEREPEPSGWKEAWRKLLRSRVTFVVLQVLDLGTTLAVFHAGGFEANPLVATLTAQFGRFRGVLISKLAAVAVAMGVRRLTWVINLFYAGIVVWNFLVLLGLAMQPH
jgi:hypothetical protein